MSLNSEFDYHLSKLAEECGELTQISMKSLIFGIDSINPDTGEANRDLIKKEIGDVLTSIQILNETLGFDFDQKYLDERKEVLRRYFIMSQMK